MTEKYRDYSIARHGERDVNGGRIVAYEVTREDVTITAFLPDLPDKAVAEHAKSIFKAQQFADRHKLDVSATPPVETVMEEGKEVDVMNRTLPLIRQAALRRAYNR